MICLQKGSDRGFFGSIKRAFISMWKAIFDINLGDSTLSDCRGPESAGWCEPWFYILFSGNTIKFQKKT